MIRLDFTQESVVIVCDTCRVWYAFAFTKLEGWERAAAHEVRTHPGEKRAQDALAKARRRAPDTK